MCTLEKRGNLFILTLIGDDEHRLSPAVIDSLLSALSQAKSQAIRGSALVTTAHGRFFSNGFDLAWAQAAGSSSAARDRLHHMVESFRPVVAAFLSLPMPTVAAVSGHAAAAGFLLALSHDYILMRRDRAVLYMSEVDLGLTFPDYFTALMRSRIGSVSARRDILLGGRKLKGDEAVTMGIVESAHDGAESVVEAAVRRGEQLAQRKWNGEVYAEIRKSLYPEVCGVLGLVAKTVVASSKL
jgi:enoyl-CoA hydratase/carnithine racemase